MIINELRQEAAEKASSPEGMRKFVRILLAQLNEEDSTKIKQYSQSYCLITADKLADLFHKFQEMHGAVSEIQLNPADVVILAQWPEYRDTYGYIMQGQRCEGYIWGAEIIPNERLTRNSVILVDAFGNKMHHRSYNAADARIGYLLRKYVSCKRQFDYWDKRQQYLYGYSAQYKTDKTGDFQSKLKTLRDEIESLGQTLPPEVFERIKKTVGSTISNYPSINCDYTEHRYHDHGLGLGQKESKDKPDADDIASAKIKTIGDNLKALQTRSKSEQGSGTPICSKCGGVKEETRRRSNWCRACDRPTLHPSGNW